MSSSSQSIIYRVPETCLKGLQDAAACEKFLTWFKHSITKDDGAPPTASALENDVSTAPFAAALETRGRDDNITQTTAGQAQGVPAVGTPQKAAFLALLEMFRPDEAIVMWQKMQNEHLGIFRLADAANAPSSIPKPDSHFPSASQPSGCIFVKDQRCRRLYYS
eukprot:GHVR01051972.1.p1 GENE.GHVR01051972.1~~GHVR01051972.1.p1  ORF type:complete len:164 (-),score=21.72 GHVR01051972.1:189-680(-)